MPRKQTENTPPVDDGVEKAPAVETEPDDPIADSEDTAISNLFAELAGEIGAKVTVYRCNPNEKRKYLFKCSPEAFDIDRLRDEYGGGEFQLYIARGGALWRAPRITVEAPLTKPDTNKQEKEPGELVTLLRETIERQNREMQELREEIRQRNSAGPMDSLQMIKEVANIFAASRPVDNSGAAVDMLLKGLTLAKELQSDNSGGGEKNMISLFSDLLKSPILEKALDQANQARPGPVVATQIKPAQPAQPAQPAALVAGPATSEQPKRQANIEEIVINAALESLVEGAVKGADPLEFIGPIFDQVPPVILDMLARLPDPVAYLAQYDARVNNHKEWFGKLMTAIKLEMAEPEEQQQVLTPPLNG